VGELHQVAGIPKQQLRKLKKQVHVAPLADD
jgi:hypothetical protein